ncbi:SCO2524 family protein [Hamadaea tsunoensis]|uniref:SCO2524 family protein n=1 Tax=Hamadaea tsunoensis TaxID=53368 RepID=UPI0003FF9519|nr:SCO2524 family protein [Hamadaea tsunoensis]
MRIQPRQQLLDIWRATAAASLADDGTWKVGGRDDSNSISDAEQLLCLMTPANEIANFRLARPNEIDDEVLDALARLGDQVTLPTLLVRVLTDYLQKYRDEKGVPTFPGGTFFTPPAGVELSEEQRRLEVVESFSSSVTLTLATLAFARTFRGQVTRQDLVKSLLELEALASDRLTAALVGLLRSFAILVYPANSDEWRNLITSINQAGQPEHRVAEALSQDLREIRASLLDLSTGSGTGQRTKDDLRETNSLFQCGWSWGVVEDAPQVDVNVPGQSEGVAFDGPYLYFTVVALDGIADLFSTRTRTLNLLNEEQQRLAQALQIRWDLTQAYWAVLASFDPTNRNRWPLEDIPWFTSDGAESDYFTLMVTAISMTDIVTRRADTDLGRLGRILSELASRARITRRPLPGDPALALHQPGVAIALEGTEKANGERLSWVAQDFAALLLKRTIRVADLLKDIQLRSDLLELADDIWAHLVLRRQAGGLWDEPAGAFDDLRHRDDKPSWHYTIRVVESLVQAAKLVGSSPLTSGRLLYVANDLISEADHLFDRQLLTGSATGGPALQTKLGVLRADLERARTIVDTQPGTALALVQQVLLSLDRLALAGQDATRGS